MQEQNENILPTIFSENQKNASRQSAASSGCHPRPDLEFGATAPAGRKAGAGDEPKTSNAASLPRSWPYLSTGSCVGTG
jgi:hypothetical protein